MTALYGVGDVLYLVSNRQRQVLPVRVEEQLNRRTLEGESVTYRVRGPGAERTVELSSLSETGDIYRTLEEARTALHEKASRAIDQVLQEAQGLADQHFSPSGVTVEWEEPPPQESALNVAAPTKLSRRPRPPDQGTGDAGPSLSVVLPDGTRAKLANPGV